MSEILVVTGYPDMGVIQQRAPTGELMWQDGVLHQRWRIEEISPNPGLSFVWKPVPNGAKDAP